ncbi:MAG: CAP domain-containing protein [Acidimicrobiia bacterium]
MDEILTLPSPRRRPVARRVVVALAVGLLSAVLMPRGGVAQASAAADEAAFLAATNSARAAAGLRPMAWDPAAALVAKAWTVVMATTANLAHNPLLKDQISLNVTSQWTRVGENVGYGGTMQDVQDAFMDSSPHRANILGDYNRVGIGVARDGHGTVWVTLDFLKGPALVGTAPPVAPPPPPPPAPPARVPALWYLRATLTAGPADAAFSWGLGGDQALACDWNGDGYDTPGVFRNGMFFLSDLNVTPNANVIFAFGNPGDRAVCGDWNGDGRDTIGLFRNGTWFLRNFNSTGAPDATYSFGKAGDWPVVGDWNANRVDTIGVYRSGQFFLRDRVGGGPSDYIFAYGDPGDRPLVGDWDGNGTTSAGVWRNGALYLRNFNNSGYANHVFSYGSAGDAPLAGDWTRTRRDVLGVVRGMS